MNFHFYQVRLMETPKEILICQAAEVGETGVRLSKHQLPDFIRALQAIEAEHRAQTGKGHLDRLRDDLRV